MTKHNPDNERIKRKYFAYLKEAKRHSEPTVDAAAKALNRFEVYTKYRDFKAFHPEQAIAFKKHLAEQKGAAVRGEAEQGNPARDADATQALLPMACVATGLQVAPSVFRCRLFQSVRQGHAHRYGSAGTECADLGTNKARHHMRCRPSTEIERRNRALIAFTLLTGARDSAIASMKLKHVDLSAGCVDQDAREVKTKFSKTFNTFFFPVGDEIREIVAEWVSYLREDKLWGNDDPLFPATRIALGATRQFEASGLERSHWSSASPIRTIFREAFDRAGLPYFNPHSFRNTLVQLGQRSLQIPRRVQGVEPEPRA